MELERLYETMSTKQLLELRAAFEQDKADGADSDYCTGRLALIAGIFAKRESTTTAEESSVRLAKLAIAFEQAHAVYFPGSAHEMADLGAVYLLGLGIAYWINPFGDSITCVRCRRTSHNPNDVSQRYCGYCKVFHPERT